MKIKIWLLLYIPYFVFGHPSGEKVIAGDIEFKKNGFEFSIMQKSNKAIINWDDFSIKEGEVLSFELPSKNSAVLNRVVSKGWLWASSVSHIDGLLKSNGKVYLINQAGIIIGKKGVINTNLFLASTLNIDDESFVKGENLIFKSNSSQEIINKGKVLAGEGGIFLFATHIENSGNLMANNGPAILCGGEEIWLVEDKQHPLVVKIKGEGTLENSSSIEGILVELKGNGGNSGALAINQKGIIKAQGAKIEGGKIILSTEKGIIENSGKLIATNLQEGGGVEILSPNIFLKKDSVIDVSGENHGGYIELEGKRILMDDKSLLLANGLEGSGGKINAFSDTTDFQGTIRATGKQNGGEVKIVAEKYYEISGECHLNGEERPGFLSLKVPTLEISHKAEKGSLNDALLASFLQEESVSIAALNNKGKIVLKKDNRNGENAGISWNAPTTFSLIAPEIKIQEGCSIISNSELSSGIAISLESTGFGLDIDEGKVVCASGNVILKGISSQEGGFGINLHDETLIAVGGSGSIFLEGKAPLGVSIGICRARLQSNNGDIVCKGEGGKGVCFLNPNLPVANKVDIIGQGSLTISGCAESDEGEGGVKIAATNMILNGGNINIFGKNDGRDIGPGIDIEGGVKLQTCGSGEINIEGKALYKEGVRVSKSILRTGNGNINIKGGGIDGVVFLNPQDVNFTHNKIEISEKGSLNISGEANCESAIDISATQILLANGNIHMIGNSNNKTGGRGVFLHDNTSLETRGKGGINLEGAATNGLGVEFCNINMISNAGNIVIKGEGNEGVWGYAQDKSCNQITCNGKGSCSISGVGKGDESLFGIKLEGNNFSLVNGKLQIKGENVSQIDEGIGVVFESAVQSDSGVIDIFGSSIMGNGLYLCGPFTKIIGPNSRVELKATTQGEKEALVFGKGSQIVAGKKSKISAAGKGDIAFLLGGDSIFGGGTIITTPNSQLQIDCHDGSLVTDLFSKHSINCAGDVSLAASSLDLQRVNLESSGKVFLKIGQGGTGVLYLNNPIIGNSVVVEGEGTVNTIFTTFSGNQWTISAKNRGKVSKNYNFEFSNIQNIFTAGGDELFLYKKGFLTGVFDGKEGNHLIISTKRENAIFNLRGFETFSYFLPQEDIFSSRFEMVDLFVKRASVSIMNDFQWALFLKDFPQYQESHIADIRDVETHPISNGGASF